MKNFRLTKYSGDAAAPPIDTQIEMTDNKAAVRFGNDLLYDMQHGHEAYYEEAAGRLVMRIRDAQKRLLAKIESV